MTCYLLKTKYFVRKEELQTRTRDFLYASGKSKPRIS